MKIFVTKKSDGSDGPKIKAESYEKAKEYLKLLQPKKGGITHTITGQEHIIQIQ